MAVFGRRAAFNLIFEEPAPLVTEVTASRVSQLSKWVQTGQTALPEIFTLNMVTTDAEGAAIGDITATIGPGVVYKNGSGTQKAASQVKQSQKVVLTESVLKPIASAGRLDGSEDRVLLP